jgi:hypothetical protein
MSGIRVVIDDKAIQDFTRKTIALGDGRARRELSRGLADGGNKVRTKVRRALQDQTGVVKYATIVSKVTSYRSALTYVITTTGKGLPIKEFKWSVPGNVQAMPWNVSHLFARSFRTKVKGLLRARTTSKRFPIRALYGPSLPKELVKDKSLEAFEAGVRTDVTIAIAKRIAKMMP